ncbi:PGC-1 and ERR-induced regulator in muscle protein 1 [Manacus vitellinus]|uniref:PGC-1 and ERR-induced regulator in muscle protein 1 n=1 Tax=Manacus vitellinus TaxID=328815 RepID=UPI00115CD37A|nr:PGC-1 and ERR-induced regulator in muscle protein 1 [Manacus vitellinus]
MWVPLGSHSIPGPLRGVQSMPPSASNSLVPGSPRASSPRLPPGSGSLQHVDQVSLGGVGRLPHAPCKGTASCCAGRIFLRGSLNGSIPTLGRGTGMDNFEYSIQLNDREWAEFFLASEECNLAPASLATAEEQQKGKEPGAQSPGKTKATKPSKAGQAGGLGVRDGAPVIPDNGAAAPSGEACQGMPGKPLQPKITAAFRGDAAEGAWKDPAAEIPGVPAAEIPGVPAAEIPGVSAAEIPGVPAVKIPGVPAAEIPGVPAAEIPVVPAAEIPGFPAAEIPVVPAEIPAVPAAEIPRKPSEIPMVPSIEIPWEPTPEIPRKPSSGIPRSPPIDIPRNTAAGIPRVATPEIPWRPAPEIPRKLSPPCFADGASARSNTLDVTWPEMYDYFFCDSQEEEELGSSVEGRRSPLQREISWPELYEYFFNEPEGNRKKVKGKDRKRKKFSSLDHAGLQNEDPSSAAVKDTVIISVPEVCEHFFPETPRNRMGWRGIFSIAPASEVKRAVRALKSLLQRQIHPDSGQGPASQALVPRGSAEKFALVPLAPLGRGQVWPEGTAEDPRVLTHKDMCLVFCAFASWAVKTSDLQAPDAWKTMFLASFGTLSAIRYFRRQVREGQPRT